MKKVILVSGKANSGKDTTIDLAIEYLESLGHRCTKMAFAKYLKELCKDHLGWDGVKDEKGRTTLQYVGTDMIRDKLGWQLFHVNRICEDIQIVEDKYDFIFISDARFANELYYTKAIFLERCTDLMIIRPELEKETQLNQKQQQHKSENALGDYVHQNHITNDSTLKDLRREVKYFCNRELL